MSDALILLRSAHHVDVEAIAARADVVSIDRLTGPYCAVIRTRGRRDVIEALALDLGGVLSDVCWLRRGAKRGGDARV
jgi:hypothetical protein